MLSDTSWVHFFQDHPSFRGESQSVWPPNIGTQVKTVCALRQTAYSLSIMLAKRIRCIT